MTTLCAPHPLVFRILLPIGAAILWAALTFVCLSAEPERPNQATHWPTTDAGPTWQITDRAQPTVAAPLPARSAVRILRRPVLRRAGGRCAGGRCG